MKTNQTMLSKRSALNFLLPLYLVLFGTPFSVVPAFGESDNLIPSGNFEQLDDIEAWAVQNNAAVDFDEQASGMQSLRITSYGWLLSPEKVVIDPRAIYTVRLKVKIPEHYLRPHQATETGYQIGFEMYTDQGRRIGHHEVVPIRGTQTHLLDDAQAGDTVVRVAGLWERIDYGGFEYDAIAFDIENDLSDIPNAQSYLIKSVEPADGFTEITLARPLEENQPAGIRVRQHGHGNMVFNQGKATDTWSEVVFDVSGVSLPGEVSSAQFWPGTHSVRLAITASSNDPDRAVELLFDDVSMMEHK